MKFIKSKYLEVNQDIINLDRVSCIRKLDYNSLDKKYPYIISFVGNGSDWVYTTQKERDEEFDSLDIFGETKVDTELERDIKRLTKEEVQQKYNYSY